MNNNLFKRTAQHLTTKTSTKLTSKTPLTRSNIPPPVLKVEKQMEAKLPFATYNYRQEHFPVFFESDLSNNNQFKKNLHVNPALTQSPYKKNVPNPIQLPRQSIQPITNSAIQPIINPQVIQSQVQQIIQPIPSYQSQPPAQRSLPILTFKESRLLDKFDNYVETNDFDACEYSINSYSDDYDYDGDDEDEDDSIESDDVDLPSK